MKTYKSSQFNLLVMLLFSMNSQVFCAEQWETEITLKRVSGQQHGVLVFGMTNGATDGFDVDIDVEKPPPSLIGDAYLNIEGPVNKLSKDFRGVVLEATWRMRVQPNDEDDWYAMWDTIQFPDVGIILIEEVDKTYTNSVGPFINMRETNTVTIPADTRVYYRIIYVPESGILLMLVAALCFGIRKIQI